MRDVFKQAQQGQQLVTGHTDLTAAELKQIIEAANENEKTFNKLFDAAKIAYYMGIAVGFRAGKKDA